LDNPGNTFAGKAMESYIQTRVNQKLQKVLTDKIGDKNPELNNLLQGVLGGGKQQPAPAQPVPAQTPPAQTPPTQTPAATPQQAAPAQDPVPAQQQSEPS